LEGYLLRWETAAMRPLVVHSHGYGSAVSPEWGWAHEGLNVAGVDVRGFGRSRAALPMPSPSGWMLTGIGSPGTHVLRGAVCDLVQAARVVRARLSRRPRRTVLQGMSFGGALALMAAAVEPAADLLVAGYPSLGWAEGRRFLARAGSAAEIDRYLARLPEHSAEDVMLVLRYFDPMNFAPGVRCRTLIGIGEVDEVVPPQTVLAIASWLGGPHEVMRLPVSHSDSPQMRSWEAFERRWLALALS
jgi:cephalosporin-C deacetylase